MAPECHALLKGVCALKGITVSEYVYEIIRERFQQMVLSDNQVRQMLMNGTYPVGSKAYVLQERIRNQQHLETSSFTLIPQHLED